MKASSSRHMRRRKLAPAAALPTTVVAVAVGGGESELRDGARDQYEEPIAPPLAENPGTNVAPALLGSPEADLTEGDLPPRASSDDDCSLAADADAGTRGVDVP